MRTMKESRNLEQGIQLLSYSSAPFCPLGSAQLHAQLALGEPLCALFPFFGETLCGVTRASPSGCITNNETIEMRLNK